MPLPFLSAGAGSSIPISAGGGTSGPANSGSAISPVNIGGLFGSPATSSPGNNLLPLIVVAAIAGFVLFRRR